MISNLEEYRADLQKSVEHTRDSVRKKREERGYFESKILIDGIRKHITDSGVIPLEFPFSQFDIELIDRSGFAADFAIKSTSLISQDKGRYFSEHAPELVKYLKEISIGGRPLFEEVRQVGIYVNVRLPASYFFGLLEEVFELGERYGESGLGAGKDIVIDYSSPNAAKHLHAGHIRSTIIGHVLGNIYEACGFTVHRINYLNDWGGMGVLIEGVSRWDDPKNYENKNDMLFEIYSSFRTAQKASEQGIEIFSGLTEKQCVLISRLIGAFSDFESFQIQYSSFVKTAALRFASLENGGTIEYGIWRMIVEWSMEDFGRFYEVLDIHQDYLTGEGLYAKSGKDFVMSELTRGGVVFFDEARFQEVDKQLKRQLDEGTISQDVYERSSEEARSDIGCYVIPLENNERFVVLKSDGATIYATRDLAALKHRFEVFQPKKVIYEVGQEQQEHFDKLFRSARKLGIVTGGVDLAHIYHGFYVDSITKKKLSSRDGASNILKLLHDTIVYFRSKYNDASEFTETEKDVISKVLGVGSIILNDVKKDKKSSVPISSDFQTMMRQFEESGGAYVIYASCRAKSILRKYSKSISLVGDVSAEGFSDVEIDLMKKVLSYPEVIRRAMAGDDPVKITDFIIQLAAQFNSYYNSTPILKGDKVEQRVILAASVSRIIDNGLRVLHINSLDRI